MPQDEHFGVLKRMDVHSRVLSRRRKAAKRLDVHACNGVIRVRQYARLKIERLGVRVAGDFVRHGDAMAEKRPLHVDDVGLRAAQQSHPVPFTRPNHGVEERLVVADVGARAVGLHANACHAAEMVGHAQQVDTAFRGGAHILLHRRVGMAGSNGMGMHVTAVL